MLIYRLLHFKDQIPDVNVGLEGREKELCKPIVQIFYKTSVQSEIESTLQYWLNQRNEKKDTTLEPILHPIVTRLFNQRGKEIYVREIWEDIITNSLKGAYDSNKPNDFQSEDYGIIYRNQISNILEQTFGGRPKHRENGNSFIFDTEELSRVGRAYNLITKIQTKIVRDGEGDPEGNEGSTKERSGYNHVQDVDKCDISQERSTNNPLKDQTKASELSAKPSDPSDPSGVNSM